MPRFNIIAFRVVLYTTTAFTPFLGQAFYELLNSQGGGIFVFILFPFIIPPLSITPWYLISFQKTKLASLSLFPPLTVIPCWYLIRDRFVKKAQTMAASHDGDADFGTDAPLEGENTKRNDLWKLDHVIALIWTGIMGILSLAIIGLIILNVVMIGYVAITEKNNEQLDAVASERAEPVNGYCWSGYLIELRTYRHVAVSGKCSEPYLSGDIKTALREWKPLAKSGNAAAQFNPDN